MDLPHEKQTEELTFACGTGALCTGMRPAEESEPPGGGGIAVGIPVIVSMERGTIPPPAPAGGIPAGVGTAGEGGDLSIPLATGAALIGGVFCLS